jgi:putative flippase GtrA
MVSGFCVMLHTANLIVADRIGIPLGLAVLLSFVIVACAGYVLHACFTFRQPLAVSRLVRYSVAMSANIPLAYITIWIWHVAVGLAMPIAAPIASACMLGLNFVLGRWAIAAPRNGIEETR